MDVLRAIQAMESHSHWQFIEQMMLAEKNRLFTKLRRIRHADDMEDLFDVQAQIDTLEFVLDLPETMKLILLEGVPSGKD